MGENHSFMPQKRLIDSILEKNPKQNEKTVRAWIMCGQVYVDGQKVTKPGQAVKSESHIEVRSQKREYVSRGGEKLASIWPNINFSLTDRVIIDAGISTGGFSDFLLRQGAKGIIGIDVGYGITDISIRNHSKVALIERQNLRKVTFEGLVQHSQKYHWPTEWVSDISCVVMDVSFINSIKCVIPLLPIISSPADIVVMVKPQFEAKKSEIERGGIIRDSKTHTMIIDRVLEEYQSLGLGVKGCWPSGVKGSKGNQEVFIWLEKSSKWEQIPYVDIH